MICARIILRSGGGSRYLRREVWWSLMILIPKYLFIVFRRRWRRTSRYPSVHLVLSWFCFRLSSRCERMVSDRCGSTMNTAISKIATSAPSPSLPHSTPITTNCPSYYYCHFCTFQHPTTSTWTLRSWTVVGADCSCSRCILDCLTLGRFACFPV